MVEMKQLHALYGGTFDPVHYGHTKTIEILADLINLQSVIIVPNDVPLYRPQPEASSEQRKKMLELAIVDSPLFKLSENEIYCGNSYTSKILEKWRKKYGLKQSLAFIIGQDSFLTFPNWHQRETILNNAHLIVCQRLGYSSCMQEIQNQRWIEKYLTYDISDLYASPFGKIYLTKIYGLNISATVVRQRLKKGLSCREMVSPRVLSYIQEQKLYKEKLYNRKVV